jgi:LPXTG-site transpeptidase (sortase) family protein
MVKKVSLKGLLLIGAVGSACCVLAVFSLLAGSSAQASYTNTVLPVVKATAPGLPARLKIPKIKVDTALESVGLMADGSVGIPKGPTNAAWFKLGSRPGEVGSAVITGHFGVWKGGLPTVFNNLYKLRPGDKLQVKDKKGLTITFVVRELRTYGENEEAPDVFSAIDDKAHLNLITCQGIWNKARKSYSERLVVFAERE